jgi:hypothetical protein
VARVIYIPATIQPSKMVRENMHGYTVFDNNAYKRESPERIKRIVDAERASGTVALASVVILQEMLARVRDANSERRWVNRAAIRKVGIHCGAQHGGKTLVSFISHTDSQVYRLIRGRQHPGDRDMFEELGQVVGTVTEAGRDDTLGEIAGILDAVEATVAAVEAAYISGLQAVTANAFESNQMKRNLDYAAAVAARAAKHYGAEFAPTEVVLQMIEIAKAASIGFALRDSVVREVRAKNGGHGQHANTVWDEEVVSSTSMYTTIGGKSLLLVTEEARLLEAAVSAGASDRVCQLANYEAILGLPAWKSSSTP